MNIGEIMREQRRLKELLGVSGVVSALEEARRSSNTASQLAPLLPKALMEQALTSRSLVEQAGVVSLGSAIGREAADRTIAAYLREHGALTSSSFARFAGAVGTGSLSDRFPAQMAAHRDRIARDMAGMGRLGRMADLERLASGDYAFKALMRSEIGAATRAASWARGLQAPGVTLTSILKAPNGLDGQIGRLSKAALDIASMGGIGPKGTRLGAFGEATLLKMSTFGGALDMLGPQARLGGAAFDSLLGGWRTRADLPPGFWRDRPTRARVYRDADVDQGLIDAEASDVVEVLVESGVVEGERSGSGVRAVVEVGPMRLAVTTAQPRYGAFRVIDGSEVAFRAFVARKLEAHSVVRGEDPAKWFARRVPGDVVRRAKDVRQAAYRAGEERRPLINFTNLGDLISVVTRVDNWTEVFGAVFGDRDGFVVDFRRLNENRRPAMHARPMDGVRLAEIMLTVRRLTSAMAGEVAADDGWDDDA